MKKVVDRSDIVLILEDFRKRFSESLLDLMYPEYSNLANQI